MSMSLAFDIVSIGMFPACLPACLLSGLLWQSKYCYRFSYLTNRKNGRTIKRGIHYSNEWHSGPIQIDTATGSSKKEYRFFTLQKIIGNR